MRQNLDSIEQYPCLNVDVDFCSHLADVLNLDQPRIGNAIARDEEGRSELFQWNSAFVSGISSIDPDMVDAAVGGTSRFATVAPYPTTTTHKEVWTLLGFLEDSVRNYDTIAEFLTRK